MKKKHSEWLLAAGVAATIYLLYLCIYYARLVLSSSGVARETAVTLLIFIAPHIIITAIGAVFNWFAFATNVRALAFSSGILYIIGCIAGILYLPANLFIIPSIILSFIGFIKLKEINNMNDSKFRKDENN